MGPLSEWSDKIGLVVNENGSLSVDENPKPSRVTQRSVAKPKSS